ncbi:PAAR domain-containing protein [Haloglomus halophilum]|uniref:PAAR domain-containing protein n=1 Tax=Haloglomus halophilum TaxID=2962672 RepID=UPI0033137EA4
MPPGVRVGDMTAHGTPLNGVGSPNVLIGGLPAWRAGADVHSCPLSTGPVPHVGGSVVTGSTTVLINGYPAVRVGDTIAENGPPNTIVSGAPTVLIDSGVSATTSDESASGSGESSSDSADATPDGEASSVAPPDLPPTGAMAPVEPVWVLELYERLASYIERYNGAVGGADLGAAQEQLASEQVNLRVTAAEGVAEFSFVTDGQTRIGSFQRGPRDDATIRMETDRETVERIEAADRPARAFRDALVDDDISIRGVGTVNRVKWAIAEFAEEVADLFGLV